MAGGDKGPLKSSLAIHGKIYSTELLDDVKGKQ